MTGIYSWASIDGWIAFLSDLAWQHSPHHQFVLWKRPIVQTAATAKTATFTRGGALKSKFAFTQGNVISNAGA